MNSKAIDYTALIINIIGAINWGLIGFFKFNLVSAVSTASACLDASVITEIN